MNRQSNPVRALLAFAAGAVLMAGCAMESGDTTAEAAQAQARARASWKLALDFEGSTIEYPLEQMYIFIFDTDDPERWPETFELSGDGITLVGSLPVDAQVGYGEELEHLVGQRVAIGTHGGDPHDPKYSTVRLAGMAVPVTGGTITFEKVTGKWAGLDGDRTVWGTVRVEAQGADGPRTLEGAFAVHVISLG